ncbi:MAG: alpha/beta fold hydrolase [Alphaproteobacteria bacterium]|nr:alpha/beta fold hydrolase [Alphaproteobacteria bacterium]
MTMMPYNGWPIDWISLSNGWRDWNSSSGQGASPPLSLPPPMSAQLLQQMQRQSVDQMQQVAQGYQRYRQASQQKRQQRGSSQKAGNGGAAAKLARLLWQSHDMRLLAPAEQGVQGGSHRPAVLIVPSLVNRAGIFDLQSDAPEGSTGDPGGKSFIAFLQQAGVTPLLLDWGVPQPAQADWGLDAYVQQGLLPALAAAGQWLGRPPALLGYCMGGNLALAAALLAPALLSRLILLATPWNFHGGDGLKYGQQVQAIWPWIEDQLARHHQLPTAALQLMLLARDPMAVMDKFRRASQLDGQAWQDFVAVEDWLNDGVPLTAPVARETLQGWFVQNQPAIGQWQIAERPMVAAHLTHPLLLVVAARDKLVPPASALSLADDQRNAKILMANTGHLGLMASRQVIPQVWQPIVDWL